MAPAMEHVDHRHSPKATKMDHSPRRSDIDVEINRNARGSSLGPFAGRPCTDLHPPRSADVVPSQMLAANIASNKKVVSVVTARGPDSKNFEEIGERTTRGAPSGWRGSCYSRLNTPTSSLT